MKVSIKFELTNEELQELQVGFVDWVETYEK